MDLFLLTREDIYRELTDLANTRGIETQEDWDSLMDEVVDSYLEAGDLGPENDVIGLKEHLSGQWEKYMAETEPEETF